MILTNAQDDCGQTASVPSTLRRPRLMESFTGNMASATDEDQFPFLRDGDPDPITPFLSHRVVEEEIHTVKRTITTSEFAQTASPKTPTRQRVNRGFSSPPSPSNHSQHIFAASTPLGGQKSPATPMNQGTARLSGIRNRGKRSRTPSPVATQHTPLSTPQMNPFTQAPFTQANRVVTPPMPSCAQPRNTSPMPYSTPFRTQARQHLKYYPIHHPTELEPFISKYFYVVTVGQDVGIFATWDEANARVSGIPGGSHSRCKNWEEAYQIYSKAYTEGRVRRIPAAGGIFDNSILLDSPNSNGERDDEV